MIGLTATIGIGDSNSQDQATDYVLDMCAKIGLQSAPSQPSDVSAIMNCPEEGLFISWQFTLALHHLDIWLN